MMSFWGVKKFISARKRHAARAGSLVVCFFALIISALPDVNPSSTVQAGDFEPKIVKIGYFADNVFHVGQSDEEVKSGYGYEYYQAIANYSGWEYEYYYGSWSDVYDAFLAGEIDIIDDISYTPERAEIMDFSTYPMGEEKYYIFVPDDERHISISDINSLNGTKIGVNENSMNETLLRNFIEENGLDITIVPCSGAAERLELLEKEEIDAMVTTESFTNPGFRATFNIGSCDIYYGVQKNRPDLLEELNYGMQRINEHSPNFNGKLRDKYFTKTVVRTSITEKEAGFIKIHPIVTVGYRRISMPFADENSVTGECEGMLADILAELSEMYPVTFETIAYTSNDEIVEALKAGEIDCAYPVIDNVWYSEQQGYIQTTALTTESMALIYKGEYQGIDNYRKLGYTKGAPAQRMFLFEHGMDGDVVTFNSDYETIAALQKGEIDAMVMNSVGWVHYSNTYPNCEGLHSVALDGYVGYSFAVAPNRTELYGILESGIGQISEALLVEAKNRHSQVYADYSFGSFIRHNLGWTTAIFLGAVLLAVLGFLAFGKLKKDQTTLSYSAEHDALTGIYNRSVLARVEADPLNKESKICLIMVDIDDFKNVNDDYGHEMGDRVIKKVADLLVAMVRTQDMVIRFGGDEFMIIMRDITMLNQSIFHTKFENLRQALLDNTEGLPKVSVSIGLAFSEIGYCNEVFEKADEALYASKNAGKKTFTICKDVVQ